MEVKVVVLYRKALAHYNVAEKETGWFEASLLNYSGNSNDLPPPRLKFIKDGRHCSGNTEEQDLMDDLYDAVQRKLIRGDGPPDAVYNPQ